MSALVCVCIIEEVAHAHAQNTPLEWHSSDTRSRVQASERDLLVAYPVIDIRGSRLESRKKSEWPLRYYHT